MFLNDGNCGTLVTSGPELFISIPMQNEYHWTVREKERKKKNHLYIEIQSLIEKFPG